MGSGGGHIALSAPAKNTTISTPWKYATEQVCFHQRAFSRGIWFGDDPLEYIFPVMMLQIVCVFYFSRSMYWLLRPLRQPKFICNVLAGIILGPSGLGRNKKFYALMNQPKGVYMMYIMSLIGAVYFVFLTAVKMEVTAIFRTARTTWKIALSGFFFPFFTVYLLRYALKMKSNVLGGSFFAFSCATSLSFTYFIVIARALEELNLITSELGQLALSLSIVYDAAHLAFWIVGVAIGQENLGYSIGVIAAISAFIAFTIFIIRPLILMIVRKTPKGKPVKEIYIVSIFTGVAVMAAFSNWIGIATIHGALLLGLAIPNGPPLGSTLTEKADVLVSEVFLQLVFVLAGSEIDVFSIKNWKVFVEFQFVIVTAFCAKLLGTLLAALHSNIMLKNAILLSLIINVRGVIEIYIYRRWLVSKVRFILLSSFALTHCFFLFLLVYLSSFFFVLQLIDNQTFTQLVLSMLVLTMIVVPMIEIYYKPQMRINQHNSLTQKGIRSIQELKNNTEFRILSCVHAQENVRGIITLLESTNPTEASPLSTYVIHLVELVGRAIPRLVQYKMQRRKSENLNSANSEYITRAFVNFSNNSRGPVTIHPFVLIAPHKTMHECICRFALENLIHFIIIPFHENQRLIVENQAIAALRHLNISLQEFAPCTVGILVDRSFAYQSNSTNFSYRVAVIFIGGLDDREALALAARMSSHSAVSITVYHFIVNSSAKSYYEKERKVDEFHLEEFKLKNRRNPRAVVTEIVSDDRASMIDSLRSIENNYDLMMVGCRRENELTIDEEMSGFVENAELGVIGDMLASTDICGDEASVLVMHRGYDADLDHRIASAEHSGRYLMGSEVQRSNVGRSSLDSRGDWSLSPSSANPAI